MYVKQSEYVNATALCMFARGRNVLNHWLENATTKRLMKVLDQQLEDRFNVAEPITLNINNCTYIHPSLVPHLATWLGPCYNYPICKLLQHVIRTPVVPVHAFTFFAVKNSGPLKPYYALESKLCELKLDVARVMRKHWDAEIIFQHLQVADTTRVLNNIRKDFKLEGNICIDWDMYCGSTLTQVQVLELINKYCYSDTEPNII